MTIVIDGTNGISGVDGSAGTPAIQGNDSNTGLWFPAADTVAISTSGSERMRLDSSGNLGIGTSSPGYPLQVRRAGGAGSLGITVDSVGSINRVAQYYSIGDTTAVTTGHAWYTRNASAADNLSLLLDNSGNLGLGVTPSAWWSGHRALEISTNGCAIVGQTNAPVTHVTANAFQNSSLQWIYKTTYFATRYMQDATTGQHQWFTASSGTAGNAISFTQAMTLDASGNLGIGETSPGTKLTIRASSPTIRLTDSNTAVSGGVFGTIDWLSADSSMPGGLAAKIDALDDATVGDRAALRFFTNNGTSLAERARITSGGYAKFSPSGVYSSGATTPAHSFDQSDAGYYSLYVYHTASATANAGINVTYPNRSPNGTGDNFLICSDSTTVRAAFRSNGGLANYSGNDANLSDRREKTNFAPAKSYLNTICAIPVQTFNYIDQSPDDPGLTLGVVAQDVQAVAPELVVESNWGTEDNPKMRLSIYQTDLQYALMKCIQELKAQNDELRARLAAAGI